ncbi:MAG: alkaline phosphatase family protein [Solirubrobacterales bacterium]|nr:alkaline phosphatase family protein [Solirubrobacterales bacterium]
MFTRSRFVALAAITAAVVAVTALPGAGAARTRTPRWASATEIQHVLLISVDGLHESDLRWYVRHHPRSELAALSAGGADYTHALTPIPSDSFPGMIGQVTGGDPRTTGVYYDAEYDHDLLPAGTTSCPRGAPTGAPVTFDESIDKDSTALDAGQGLGGLPAGILNMTGDPTPLINPARLPVDPSTCKPVYPHQYLQVNTIFNVAHDHGLLTAWSDKHPAYEILDGPEGDGVDDLFTPEIASDAIGYPSGDDWTSDNAATMQYDSYKVHAILNEIDGDDHSGTRRVGVPAIFGMNFQTISTAQKLPSSDGLTGGYEPGTHFPGPLLQRALGYLDDQLAAMVSELKARGLAGSTAIIISAKHGQSPEDPDDLTRIDDGPIIDAINAAWKQSHPTAPALVAASTNDDAIMMWLSDRSPAATSFVADYLTSHSATGNTITSGSRTLDHSGLSAVYAGAAAARYFGVPASDPRHPDVWGVVQHGVVYTGATKKIAEHGGADPEDRHVALLVDAPGAVSPGVFDDRLETTSIAPTILRLLGLDPNALEAVREQGTPVLPGVR